MVVLSNNQRLLTCWKGRLLFKEMRQAECRIWEWLSVSLRLEKNRLIHYISASPYVLEKELSLITPPPPTISSFSWKFKEKCLGFDFLMKKRDSQFC